MAQTQKTIRFNKETDKLVQQISPAGESNYNYAVNQIAHRYSVMCRYLMPDTFTDGEFKAICQAYNGHFFNADIELEAKAFTWQIREAIAYDESVRELLGDYMSSDFPEFIAKIDALTIPEIIAVFQAVHEFWCK